MDSIVQVVIFLKYYLKEVAFIWVQSQSNKQKMHWTTKKNNQNWINIYVLPFKAMAILASYCLFIHMNVKELKPKIHLMKF
jgi:hypothetical protein